MTADQYTVGNNEEVDISISNSFVVTVVGLFQNLVCLVIFWPLIGWSSTCMLFQSWAGLTAGIWDGSLYKSDASREMNWRAKELTFNYTLLNPVSELQWLKQVKAILVTKSLTPSVVKSSSESLIQSFSLVIIHLFNHAVMQSLSHAVIHSSSHPLIHLFSHSVLRSCTYSVMQLFSHFTKLVLCCVFLWVCVHVC